MVGDTATATTVVSQRPMYQQHAYKSSAQSAHYTPMGSGANTPMNLSPTSPRSTSHFNMYHQNAPQIRRPKNPIYVPAALRRTEKPAGRSPPKGDTDVETPSSNWGSGPGNGPAGGYGNASNLSLITSEDLNSIYGDTPLSPVTGPITRNHWQPDSSTNVCTASMCQSPFGFFNRRHHCRKCGGIFCNQHAQHKVKLNEHALFHPEGELERACDRCFAQYCQWEQMRTSRHNSESSRGSGSTGRAIGISTPTAPAGMKRPQAPVGSIQNSFSGAWNWSTF